MQLPTALCTFVNEAATLLERNAPPPFPCPDIALRLGGLVADGSWLAPEWRVPSEQAYRRQCLYEHPDGAFSIGCFVWAPHQRTPIHDHRSWGVIGVLSGAITSETYTRTESGLAGTAPIILPAGLTAWVHPTEGDIHRIGGADQGGISIHVYGCRFDTVCNTLYEG